MLSLMLENHYKVQEQLQQTRSTKRPLSCDAVIRECLKWNQEYPDIKVEFRILFPKNFKAKGIKPMDEMCFIRELAQNQENALQYQKVTSEQMVIFMQNNRHLDFNKRAVWRLEEELYEKKFNVECDTLMKKLLDWNKKSKREKIKFWIQTPLFWNHPDIEATNGKYVQVVDLTERKPSPEEMEREFHLRFNSRIKDLDFQDLAVKNQRKRKRKRLSDEEYKKILYDNIFGKAVYMEPQRRIRTRFMFAHTKHLSESPEDYKFDESRKQLVLKSPEEIESTLNRCRKEIEFRDKYMKLYDLEKQALRSHPMAPAFKIKSIALKFVRGKFMEEFGELFFPEERYIPLLRNGSPKIKPHKRPTQATCIILSKKDNRSFQISRNIGKFEIFPVIAETPDMPTKGNTRDLQNLPMQFPPDNVSNKRAGFNNAAGDTSDANNLTNERNSDKQKGLDENLEASNNDSTSSEVSKRQKPKKYNTRGFQMWKETKQRKLVVIGKRRYSVKRQKNMKRIIADQGKAIGVPKGNSNRYKYNATNRSRGKFKVTHLCIGRRSESHESVFDRHGQHQNSRSFSEYPFSRQTYDDTILTRLQIATGCTEIPEELDQSSDLYDDEVQNEYDAIFDDMNEEDINECKFGKEIKRKIQRPKFTSTARYSIEDGEIEYVKKATPQKSIIQWILKKLNLSSREKKAGNLQIQNTKVATYNKVGALQHTEKPVSKPERKNIAFDLFDEPRKPKPKPKLLSEKSPSSGEENMDSTNHENPLQRTEEPVLQSQRKYVAFEILNEPRKPKPKPNLSSDKRPTCGRNDLIQTKEKTATHPTQLKQSEEPVERHIHKSVAFDIFDEPAKPKQKPKLSSATTRRSSNGNKRLKNETGRQKQTTKELSKTSNQSKRCRAKIGRDVKVNRRRIHNPERWPSRLTPINEYKEYRKEVPIEQCNEKDCWSERRSKQAVSNMPPRRVRFRCTPRSYNYSKLQNTAIFPSRIPVNQDQSTNRKVKVTKDLNVVKTKYRYSRLHRISREASLLPSPWTRSEEMMTKLEKRNTMKKQADHDKVCGDVRRLGRTKQREIPTKRTKSKIPARVRAANVPVNGKEKESGIEKAKKNKIPRRISGFIKSSSEKGEDNEKGNVYELKTGLPKSRIPKPIHANKMTGNDRKKGHKALAKATGNENTMPFCVSPTEQKSKPHRCKSQTNLAVSPAHLHPLPTFGGRQLIPLLGKIPTTMSRPATVAGYCVLPPIGKSRGVKRQMSAGANRKFLPAIEQIVSRPLSAYGYAKLPPIPRRE